MVTFSATSTAYRRSLRVPRIAAAAIGLAFVLGGCSSVLSELPTSLGGLPAGTPERPETPVAYPAVHDMPPARQAAVLTQDEQKKAETELMAARDQQIKRSNAKKDQDQDQ